MCWLSAARIARQREVNGIDPEAYFADSGERRSACRSAEEGFDFPVHMHMLRHACGYHYANRGEDTRALQLWLGHRSIQHTVRYSELSAERFKDW